MTQKHQHSIAVDSKVLQSVEVHSDGGPSLTSALPRPSLSCVVTSANTHAASKYRALTLALSCTISNPATDRRLATLSQYAFEFGSTVRRVFTHHHATRTGNDEDWVLLERAVAHWELPPGAEIITHVPTSQAPPLPSSQAPPLPSQATSALSSSIATDVRPCLAFPTVFKPQEAIALSEAQSGPALFESTAPSTAEYESESSRHPAAHTLRRPLDFRPRSSMPTPSAADVNTQRLGVGKPRDRAQGLVKRRKTKHANWDGESLWDDVSQKKAAPANSTPIEPPTGKARRRANQHQQGTARGSLRLSFKKCSDSAGFIVTKADDPNSTPRVVAPPAESQSESQMRTKKRRAIRPLEDDEASSHEPVAQAPCDSRDARPATASNSRPNGVAPFIMPPPESPPEIQSRPVPRPRNHAPVHDEPGSDYNKRQRRDATISWICCDDCDAWRIVPPGVCVDASLPWSCEKSKIWGGTFKCRTFSNDETPPAELLRRSNSSESIVIVASAHDDSETRPPTVPQDREATVESAIALHQLKKSSAHEEKIPVEQQPRAQPKPTKGRRGASRATISAQREAKKSDADYRNEIVARVRNRKQREAPVAVQVAKLFPDENQTSTGAGLLTFVRRRRLTSVFRVRTRN